MAVQEIQEFGRFHLSSFYLVFKSCAVHAPCSCKMWKTCSTYNRPAYAAVNKTRFTPHNLRTLLCPCRWIWIYGVELPIHGTSSSLDSAPKPPVTLYSSLFGEKIHKTLHPFLSAVHVVHACMCSSWEKGKMGAVSPPPTMGVVSPPTVRTALASE